MSIIVDLSARPLNFSFDDNGEREFLWPDRPDLTLGAAFAKFILAEATDGPAVKYVMWCYALGENRPIELNDKEYDLLYDLADKSKIAAILRGQILIAMEEAKKS
jgi:hypothetical protein